MSDRSVFAAVTAFLVFVMVGLMAWAVHVDARDHAGQMCTRRELRPVGRTLQYVCTEWWSLPYSQPGKIKS